MDDASARQSGNSCHCLAHHMAACLLSLQDGFLTADPRSTSEPWQVALQGVAAELLGQAAGASHVAQLLSVAFAQHELTGGSTDAGLAWLEAGGGVSIEELQQQQQQAQHRSGA